MAGRFKNTLQRWLHAGSAALALDLALIAALAAAAAYGTWVLLAPRAKAAPALGEQARALEAPSPAARRLFGASSAPQAAASGAVRLIGVVSPSRALFTENGRPRAAAVGESVGELVVREIHPDHVVVSRRGELERLVLERRSAPLEAPGGARGNAGR
jgi:type II secretion system (T2SS) protein C